MNASLKNRIRRTVAFLNGVYFIWMAYMLLTPRPEVPPIGFAIDFLHLGAFFALAFGVGLTRRKWSSGRWRVALLVWAVASECLQILTGRCFEIIDIVQNVAGILLGLEAARRLRDWARKRNGVSSNDAESDGRNNAKTSA